MTDNPSWAWPPVVLAVLLHLIALAVVAWDLYASFDRHPEYTVSAILTGWAEKMPVLPFAFGLLAGHLFWGRWPIGPRGG